MTEELKARLEALARRAGIAGLPPAVVIAAAVCLAIAVSYAAWHWWPRQPAVATYVPGAAASRSTDAATSAAPSEEPSGTVCVHVTGAVRSPGVYTLPTGSRVVSAIDAAGGLLPGAAQAGVNLAEALRDGEQIVVPTQEEFAQGTSTAGGGTSTGGAVATAGRPVNINTADAAMLDTLPGIGPTTAAKIIADRTANGPFKSTDDLGRVSGIGDKTLADLEGLISVK
ncbi:MAG: ComEA family DNA-binding protein [Coriobacteriia bacterium]|nr:ComEA family DNA-binding protein [Coriobacteriia bacterium]